MSRAKEATFTTVCSDITKLTEKLDQLYLLVIGGGKESRVVETVPAWRAKQCDGVCDFTDTPIPNKSRVLLGKLRVHPGVKAWAKKEEIEDIEDCDPDEVPADYLVVPTMTRLRKRYVPTPRIQWDNHQLEDLQRASLAIVARDMGLTQICKEVHNDLDWRFETKAWIISALQLLRDAEDRTSVKLTFDSETNREVLDTGPGKSSGGARKGKSRSKKKSNKGKNDE